MKRISSIFFCFLIANILACSGFNIKKTISDSSALKKLRKSGIVVRVWQNGAISSAEIQQNLAYWIEGHKKINDLTFIQDGSPELLKYSSENDRFFQRDEDKSFLSYKSTGVFQIYKNRHREELNKFINSNGLDSIIFYEVDGFSSSELQFININSSIIIADTKLNIIFMDHHTGDEDVDEWDKDSLKKILLDKISLRFIYSMESLDYIDK